MIKLVQIDTGVFDLAFDASDDIDAAIFTDICAILFTDAEAPLDRVPEPWERRGWWADPTRGTGLWYVRRQGLSDAARQEALDMIRSALLQHNTAFSEIRVTETLPPGGTAGSVSSVFYRISGKHNGLQFALDVTP